MNFLARDTLYAFRPFAWFIDSVNAIPIDREGTGLAGVKETLRRLKRGEMVLMFPEGTRTRDGKIGPFRPGFTTLAVRGRAAVLPAAIEGAYDAWPRRQRLPGPATIHVHYGQPLLADEITEFSDADLIGEVERRVHACHALLCRRPTLAKRARRSRSF
jgi:1-acyl-sn-glycerol-3-phosphate acyltransferase